MKKPLFFFLMMLLPLSASAEAVEINGIFYNLIPKGKVAEVTSSPYGYSGKVEIPETVIYGDNAYSVTSINGSSFNSCRYLTSISIPKTVTKIAQGAFEWCVQLDSIYITDLTAWCSIEHEEGSSFLSCNHLCLNNEEITDLVIPNDITKICAAAFYGCRGLTSVRIHDRVNCIGDDAFSGCNNLTGVHIPSLESWCTIDFSTVSSNPLYYAHHLLLNGEEIKDLVIPDNVSSIGNNAFAGCSALTNVSIPQTVTRIGNSAFLNCVGLNSVTVPNSVTNIGSSAFGGCSSLTEVTISNSVTIIGSSTFSGCNSLKEVTIPSNVTSIESYAFLGCSALTTVKIPNSVTSIGNSAFEGCSNLIILEIGNSVARIGTSKRGGTFASCPGLTDVYCYAEKVPDANELSFSDSYVEYILLHVPATSINDYKKTKPWSSFKDVVPLSPHTLTYYVDGEIYKTYLYGEGIIIPVEEAPEKEGYTFSGWSEIPEKMPDHDVEIIGTFTVNKYNLTYMVDGEEYKTVEIEYGAEITPEDGPEKERYTFTGWSVIPKTMPANDVIVTGIYEKNLLGKCVTPTIAFKDGKFKFESEDEGVEFVWAITIADNKEGRGNEADINGIYKVSVYATKEDYENSDTAAIEVDIRGVKGDMSGDGKVDATDLTKLIEILLK